MSRQRSTASAWVLAFTPVVLIVGLMAWGFIAVESLGTPRADVTVDPADFLLVPDPTPTGTPEPTATPDAGTEPSLVEVEPIENMDRTPGAPSLDFYLTSHGALVDSTYLGARDIWHAFGLLSDQGDVCMWVTVADPEANPGISGAGTCATYADFTREGLALEKSGWEVRWSPGGTVEWIS
jgi:hypothetical protein